MLAQYVEFVSRFEWAKQGPLGGLKILRAKGPIQGDCRNFALTIAWIAAGHSVVVMLLNILVGNTVLWFCWNKGPHMSVWENGEGWICSSHRAWRKRSPNTRILPLQPILMGILIAISLI